MHVYIPHRHTHWSHWSHWSVPKAGISLFEPLLPDVETMGLNEIDSGGHTLLALPLVSLYIRWLVIYICDQIASLLLFTEASGALESERGHLI